MYKSRLLQIQEEKKDPQDPRRHERENWRTMSRMGKTIKGIDRKLGRKELRIDQFASQGHKTNAFKREVEQLR